MAIRDMGTDLQQQLAQRERELDALWQITQAMASVTGEASLARMALHTALDVVGAEAGSILLHDPAANQLVFRHVEGGGEDLLRDKVISVTEGIAGEVFNTRRARISHDVTSEAAHAREIGEQVGYATRNMITVPLCRREGEPVGVIQVLNKRSGELDERDLRLLEMLGSQVALAVEQARLYQDAKLAEIMRLLGDIAHDLKNMITPVVMAAGLLETIINDLIAAAPGTIDGTSLVAHNEATSEPPLHVEAVAILKDASDRVQARVKEIADCVKGVTAPLKLAPCDVNRVARQVMDLLRPVAEQDQITLVLRPADALHSIDADEDRLFSMLYNLTDNAMSAVRRAERPGQVMLTISAAHSASGEAVVIEMSDSGCGMSQEILQQLFTSGVRSSTTLGTGLGTRIVKDVVQMHGGKIEARSKLDEGTTFHIELPVSRS